MSEDGAIGNVREAFQGKRGKILIVGGGLAIAAYVIYTRRNGTPEEVLPDEVPVEGPGRIPQTDPEVGNSDNGAGVKPGRPTSNAAWLSDGVDFLIGRGTPAALAHDALTKALGGLPITTQQVAWVSQVISALGSPPEGMPPINAAPIPPPQQKPPPPVVNPPPVVKPPPPPAPPKPAPPKPPPAPVYYTVTVAKYTSRNPPWNSTMWGIAKHYGYGSGGSNYYPIWNDSRNKALRDKRKSPTKIQPGDRVYVKKK